MSIRDARPYNDYRRKANQQWELAGQARQDGDKEAELEHMRKAKEFDQLANEVGS